MQCSLTVEEAGRPTVQEAARSGPQGRGHVGLTIDPGRQLEPGRLGARVRRLLESGGWAWAEREPEGKEPGTLESGLGLNVYAALIRENRREFPDQIR